MKKILLISFLMVCTICNAQVPKPALGLGLNAHYGFIFAHSQNIQNSDQSRPFGLDIDMAWQLLDEKTWKTCRCFPRMGFSATWFNYDNSVLGHSFNGIYFIEPAFVLGKGLQLGIKGSLGLSYLSNPYDAGSNPNNLSYSMPFAGYIGLSLGFHFPIMPTWEGSLFANYFHISNGGIKDPNKGIDWPTLSGGIAYKIRAQPLPQWKKSKTEKIETTPQVSVYGLLASRIVAVGDKERYLIYGFGLQMSRQISSLNELCVGAEWHTDLALGEHLRRQNRTEPDPSFGGLLLGHGFLLGRFVFSQHIGFYVYRPVRDFDRLYHRYGLMYNAGRHWQTGINFKAHAQYAHFMDFRLGYLF